MITFVLFYSFYESEAHHWLNSSLIGDNTTTLVFGGVYWPLVFTSQEVEKNGVLPGKRH